MVGGDVAFYPYLARISPFTDACASVANEVLSTARMRLLEA
jgi:hypothetical protein